MTFANLIRYGLVAFAVTFMMGCATSPPEAVDNVCDIFREKSGWYEDAKESRARWGVPVSVSMAFMYQESRFVATGSAFLRSASSARNRAKGLAQSVRWRGFASPPLESAAPLWHRQLEQRSAVRIAHCRSRSPHLRS